MLNKLWSKINGTKTITGLVITGIGVCMFNNPFTVASAPYILNTGLLMLGIGVGSKIEKKAQSKSKE